MALTKETIVANESLANLTEEQVAAIATLSQNSEDELFRQKMGEHYRKLDASIEEHSGVARNGDEKTYDYLPRAIDAMKGGYEETIKTLRSENETLRANGSADAALQARFDAQTKELNTAKKEFNALKDAFDNANLEHAKALEGIKIDNEIARAMEGIEFRAGLNAELLATAKERAIASVRGKNPTFEERDGEQRLVFHEGDEPMLNRENQLKPFSAKELLMREFGKFDILNTRPSTGAGGEGTKPTAPSALAASTQVEAMDAIDKMAQEKGFSKGTADYQAEVNRLWVENKCSTLPIK